MFSQGQILTFLQNRRANKSHHDNSTWDEETTSSSEDSFHFSFFVQEDGWHGSGHGSFTGFLLVTGQVVNCGPELGEIGQLVVVDESKLSRSKFGTEAENTIK